MTVDLFSIQEIVIFNQNLSHSSQRKDVQTVRGHREF